jgi:signal transduction histidine kinase
MSLFWKIFLWFLLAISAIVGVSVFISWTTQGDISDRWRNMLTNTMTVYTGTAKQIYDNEGEQGVSKFIQTIQATHQNRVICLAKENDSTCLTLLGENSQAVIQKALASDNVEFQQIRIEENYSAKKFVTVKGEKFVLVMKMDFPRNPQPFGQDWTNRIVRILALLLTAALVCYALARYLVKPILQLREATKKLADGELKTRIHTKRRDELGQLARDFDEMAERIENLITSQQRLTMDISHELRSPLARMNVALELAKAKSKNGNEPLLIRIENESIRLNEMISNILTLSKLETKSETVEKMEVNLTRLFEHIVTDAKFEAEGKGKTVEVLKKDEAKIFGNERLLRSAIENVLRNAVRYTKDKVEVSLENNKSGLSVKIRDYGEGIPENDLKEIFRPFYRVSEARDRKSGGIGLGLAITEQAVHAHLGSVSAKNLGDGLLVEISLPFLHLQTI